MTPAVRAFLLGLAPAVAPWLWRSLLRSCSLRILNRRVRDDLAGSDRGFVAVLWHQHVLWSLECAAGRKVVTLCSRSPDGEFPARTLRRLGHLCARGSSSEGGAGALLRLTRLVRRGYGAVITPDGPHGPARRAKPGFLQAARDAGVPVVPVGVSVSPALSLPTWDRAAIPMPSSRIVLAYGEPVGVPQDAGRTEFERLCVRIEGELAALEAQGHRLLKEDA